MEEYLDTISNDIEPLGRGMTGREVERRQAWVLCIIGESVSLGCGERGDG